MPFFTVDLVSTFARMVFAAPSGLLSIRSNYSRNYVSSARVFFWVIAFSAISIASTASGQEINPFRDKLNRDQFYQFSSVISQARENNPDGVGKKSLEYVLETYAFDDPTFASNTLHQVPDFNSAILVILIANKNSIKLGPLAVMNFKTDATTAELELKGKIQEIEFIQKLSQDLIAENQEFKSDLL